MIRDYTKEDYATLCEWWKSKDFTPPPEELLPATGYVCNEIAAGFLYLTNSPIAWAEWIVGNPEVDKEARSIALDELINHVCCAAKKAGSIVVFSSSNNAHFMKRLTTLGFVVGDTDTAQLFRRL